MLLADHNVEHGGTGMRLRRLTSVVAVTAAALLGLASPALAVGGPSYPTGGGGGGSSIAVYVAKTLVAKSDSLVVTVLNCSTWPATVTVTGPGREPGVPTASFTTAATTNPSQQTATVTFQRVGRNTITASCGGATASVAVTVKMGVAPGVKPASVLGETLQAGSAVTSGALGAVTAGATSAASAVGELVKTGANVAGPLGIAAVLLFAGALLLLASRPRQRVAARVSGRHRS